MKTSLGDDHALFYLDYDTVKEVVLIYRVYHRNYGWSKLRSREHNENSPLNLLLPNRNLEQLNLVVSNTT